MLDARSNPNVLIMRRPFKVLISLVTLVAFMFNTVSYELAWAVRDSAGLPSVGSESAGGPGSTKKLKIDTFTLPAYLGTVQYTSSAGHGATDAVVHIQDAHCNYAAQKKISEILDYLHTEYGLRTVNVEGGAREYDLSVFTDIGDRIVREKVADHFVSEGTVNGAEYYAINNPDKVELWGVEDPALYVKNLNVYKDSLGHKEEVDKVLKSLGHILANLKTHIYTNALLDFDTKYVQYKASNLPFKDYLDYLVKKARESAIDIKSFTDIYLLRQALDAESGLDFKKASSERDALVGMLQKKLSKKALEELVVKTVEFKSDRLSQMEFYTYISNKAKATGLELGIFPELQKYIVYISMYDAIDKSQIMAELEILEDGIRSALCENEDQTELAMLSKNLALLKNFFNISLTRSDYEYYRRSDESFDMARFEAFINRTAPLYKISAKPDEAIARIDDDRRKMAQFYEYSFMRDDAFVKNMKFTEEEPKASAKAKSKWTVVVTGGFHTDNLRDLFKKKGISYISVLPNFKSTEGSDAIYFKLLSGGEGSFERSIDTVISSLQVASLLNGLGIALDRKQAELLRLGVTALETLYTDGKPRAVELTGKDYVYVIFELNEKGEPICRALRRGEALPSGAIVVSGKLGDMVSRMRARAPGKPGSSDMEVSAPTAQIAADISSASTPASLLDASKTVRPVSIAKKMLLYFKDRTVDSWRESKAKTVFKTINMIGLGALLAGVLIHSAPLTAISWAVVGVVSAILAGWHVRALFTDWSVKGVGDKLSFIGKSFLGTSLTASALGVALPTTIIVGIFLSMVGLIISSIIEIREDKFSVVSLITSGVMIVASILSISGFIQDLATSKGPIGRAAEAVEEYLHNTHLVGVTGDVIADFTEKIGRFLRSASYSKQTVNSISAAFGTAMLAASTVRASNFVRAPLFRPRSDIRNKAAKSRTEIKPVLASVLADINASAPPQIISKGRVISRTIRYGAGRLIATIKYRPINDRGKDLPKAVESLIIRFGSIKAKQTAKVERAIAIIRLRLAKLKDADDIRRAEGILRHLEAIRERGGLYSLISPGGLFKSGVFNYWDKGFLALSEEFFRASDETMAIGLFNVAGKSFLSTETDWSPDRIHSYLRGASKFVRQDKTGGSEAAGLGLQDRLFGKSENFPNEKANDIFTKFVFSRKIFYVAPQSTMSGVVMQNLENDNRVNVAIGFEPRGWKPEKPGRFAGTVKDRIVYATPSGVLKAKTGFLGWLAKLSGTDRTPITTITAQTITAKKYFKKADRVFIDTSAANVDRYLAMAIALGLVDDKNYSTCKAIALFSQTGKIMYGYRCDQLMKFESAIHYIVDAALLTKNDAVIEAAIRSVADLINNPDKLEGYKDIWSRDMRLQNDQVRYAINHTLRVGETPISFLDVSDFSPPGIQDYSRGMIFSPITRYEGTATPMLVMRHLRYPSETRIDGTGGLHSREPEISYSISYRPGKFVVDLRYLWALLNAAEKKAGGRMGWGGFSDRGGSSRGASSMLKDYEVVNIINYYMTAVKGKEEELASVALKFSPDDVRYGKRVLNIIRKGMADVAKREGLEIKNTMEGYGAMTIDRKSEILMQPAASAEVRGAVQVLLGEGRALVLYMPGKSEKDVGIFIENMREVIGYVSENKYKEAARYLLRSGLVKNIDGSLPGKDDIADLGRILRRNKENVESSLFYFLQLVAESPEKSKFLCGKKICLIFDYGDKKSQVRQIGLEKNVFMPYEDTLYVNGQALIQAGRLGRVPLVGSIFGYMSDLFKDGAIVGTGTAASILVSAVQKQALEALSLSADRSAMDIRSKTLTKRMLGLGALTITALPLLAMLGLTAGSIMTVVAIAGLGIEVFKMVLRIKYKLDSESISFREYINDWRIDEAKSKGLLIFKIATIGMIFAAGRGIYMPVFVMSSCIFALIGLTIANMPSKKSDVAMSTASKWLQITGLLLYLLDYSGFGGQVLSGALTAIASSNNVVSVAVNNAVRFVFGSRSGIDIAGDMLENLATVLFATFVYKRGTEIHETREQLLLSQRLPEKIIWEPISLSVAAETAVSKPGSSDMEAPAPVAPAAVLAKAKPAGLKHPSVMRNKSSIFFNIRLTRKTDLDNKKLFTTAEDMLVLRSTLRNIGLTRPYYVENPGSFEFLIDREGLSRIIINSINGSNKGLQGGDPFLSTTLSLGAAIDFANRYPDQSVIHVIKIPKGTQIVMDDGGNKEFIVMVPVEIPKKWVLATIDARTVVDDKDLEGSTHKLQEAIISKLRKTGASLKEDDFDYTGAYYFRKMVRITSPEIMGKLISDRSIEEARNTRDGIYLPFPDIGEDLAIPATATAPGKPGSSDMEVPAPVAPAAAPLVVASASVLRSADVGSRLVSTIKKLLPHILTIPLIVLTPGLGALWVVGISTTFQCGVLALLASFIITIPLAWKAGVFLETHLWNYLRTTKYLAAYREGSRVTLHVTRNLDFLRRESSPYRAIATDTLTAVGETLKRIRTDPKFKGVTSIEAVSPLLWHYDKARGRNAANPLFAKLLRELGENEITPRDTGFPLNFVGRLAMLFLGGKEKVSIKGIAEIFSPSPLREGVLAIDISTPEKIADLENRLKELAVVGAIPGVALPAKYAATSATALENEHVDGEPAPEAVRLSVLTNKVADILTPDGKTVIKKRLTMAHLNALKALALVAKEFEGRVNISDIGFGGGFVRSLWYGGVLSDLDMFLPDTAAGNDIKRRMQELTGLSVDVLGRGRDFNNLMSMTDFTINKAVLFAQQIDAGIDDYRFTVEDPSGKAVDSLNNRELVLTHFRNDDRENIRPVIRAIRFLSFIDGLKCDAATDEYLRNVYRNVYSRIVEMQRSGINEYAIYNLFDSMSGYSEYGPRLEREARLYGGALGDRLERWERHFEYDKFRKYMDSVATAIVANEKAFKALAAGDIAESDRLARDAEIASANARDIAPPSSASLTKPGSSDMETKEGQNMANLMARFAGTPAMPRPGKATRDAREARVIVPGPRTGERFVNVRDLGLDWDRAAIPDGFFLRESVARSVSAVDKKLREAGLGLRVTDGLRTIKYSQDNIVKNLSQWVRNNLKGKIVEADVPHYIELALRYDYIFRNSRRSEVARAADDAARADVIRGIIANDRTIPDDQILAIMSDTLSRAWIRFADPEPTAPHVSGGAVDIQIYDVATGNAIQTAMTESEAVGYLKSNGIDRSLKDITDAIKSKDENRIDFPVRFFIMATSKNYKPIEDYLSNAPRGPPESQYRAFHAKIEELARNRRILFHLMTIPIEQGGVLPQGETFTANPNETWHFGIGDRSSAVFAGSSPFYEFPLKINILTDGFGYTLPEAMDLEGVIDNIADAAIVRVNSGEVSLKTREIVDILRLQNNIPYPGVEADVARFVGKALAYRLSMSIPADKSAAASPSKPGSSDMEAEEGRKTSTEVEADAERIYRHMMDVSAKGMISDYGSYIAGEYSDESIMDAEYYPNPIFNPLTFAKEFSMTYGTGHSAVMEQAVFKRVIEEIEKTLKMRQGSSWYGVFWEVYLKYKQDPYMQMWRVRDAGRLNEKLAMIKPVPRPIYINPSDVYLDIMEHLEKGARYSKEQIRDIKNAAELINKWIAEDFKVDQDMSSFEEAIQRIHYLAAQFARGEPGINFDDEKRVSLFRDPKLMIGIANGERPRHFPKANVLESLAKSLAMRVCIMGEFKEQHPILQAAEVYFRLTDLQLFGDANRRVAKLFMDYFLMRNNLPPLVISNSNKDEFVKVTRFMQSPRELADFMADELLKQRQVAAAPARSLAVNVFSGGASWLNWLLRTAGLLTLSTPLHETNHVLTARLYGIEANWTWKGLFTGKVSIARGPPAEYRRAFAAGMRANLLLSALFGTIAIASSVVLQSDIGTLLAGFAGLFNLAAGLAELLPGGDLAASVATAPASAAPVVTAPSEPAEIAAPTDWGRRWYERARAFPRDKLRWQDMEESLSEAIMSKDVQRAFKYFGLNPKDVVSNPEKSGADLAKAYKDMTGFNLDIVSLGHIDGNMQVCNDWLVIERIAAEAHRIRAVEEKTDQNFSRLSPDDKAANMESATIAADLVTEEIKTATPASIRNALDDAVELLGRGQLITVEFGTRSPAHNFVLRSGVAQHEAWRDRKERAGQEVRKGLEKAFVKLNAIEQKRDLNFIIAAVNILIDKRVVYTSALAAVAQQRVRATVTYRTEISVVEGSVEVRDLKTGEVVVLTKGQRKSITARVGAAYTTDVYVQEGSVSVRDLITGEETMLTAGQTMSFLGRIEEPAAPIRAPPVAGRLQKVIDDVRVNFPRSNAQLGSNSVYIYRKGITDEYGTMVTSDRVLDDVVAAAIEDHDAVIVADFSTGNDQLAANITQGVEIAGDIERYRPITVARPSDGRPVALFRFDHHFDVPSFDTWSATPLVVDWLRALYRKNDMETLRKVAGAFIVANHQDADMILATFLLRNASREDMPKILDKWGDIFKAVALWHDHLTFPPKAMHDTMRRMAAIVSGISEEGERASKPTFEEIIGDLMPRVLVFMETGNEPVIERYYRAQRDREAMRDEKLKGVLDGILAQAGPVLSVDTGNTMLYSGDVLAYLMEHRWDLLSGKEVLVLTYTNPDGSRDIKLRSIPKPDGSFINIRPLLEERLNGAFAVSGVFVGRRGAGGGTLRIAPELGQVAHDEAITRVITAVRAYLAAPEVTAPLSGVGLSRTAAPQALAANRPGVTAEDINRLIETNKSVLDIVKVSDEKVGSKYVVEFRLDRGERAEVAIPVTASAEEFQAEIDKNKTEADRNLEQGFGRSQGDIERIARDNPELIEGWRIISGGNVRVVGAITKEAIDIDPGIPSVALQEINDFLTREKEALKKGLAEAEMDSKIDVISNMIYDFLSKSYPELRVSSEVVKGQPGLFVLVFEKSESETLPIAFTLGATGEQTQKEIEAKIPVALTAHLKLVEERESKILKELELFMARIGVVSYDKVVMLSLARRINNSQWDKRRMEARGRDYGKVDLFFGLDLPPKLFKSQKELERLAKVLQGVDLRMYELKADMDDIAEEARTGKIDKEIAQKRLQPLMSRYEKLAGERNGIVAKMAPLQKVKDEVQAKLLSLGGPIVYVQKDLQERREQLLEKLNAFSGSAEMDVLSPQQIGYDGSMPHPFVVMDNGSRYPVLKPSDEAKTTGRFVRALLPLSLLQRVVDSGIESGLTIKGSAKYDPSSNTLGLSDRPIEFAHEIGHMILSRWSLDDASRKRLGDAGIKKFWQGNFGRPDEASQIKLERKDIPALVDEYQALIGAETPQWLDAGRITGKYDSVNEHFASNVARLCYGLPLLTTTRSPATTDNILAFFVKNNVITEDEAAYYRILSARMNNGRTPKPMTISEAMAKDPYITGLVREAYIQAQLLDVEQKTGKSAALEVEVSIRLSAGDNNRETTSVEAAEWLAKDPGKVLQLLEYEQVATPEITGKIRLATAQKPGSSDIEKKAPISVADARGDIASALEGRNWYYDAFSPEEKSAFKDEILSGLREGVQEYIKNLVVETLKAQGVRIDRSAIKTVAVYGSWLYPLKGQPSDIDITVVVERLPKNENIMLERIAINDPSAWFINNGRAVKTSSIEVLSAEAITSTAPKSEAQLIKEASLWGHGVIIDGIDPIRGPPSQEAMLAAAKNILVAAELYAMDLNNAKEATKARNLDKLARRFEEGLRILRYLIKNYQVKDSERRAIESALNLGPAVRNIIESKDMSRILEGVTRLEKLLAAPSSVQAGKPGSSDMVTSAPVSEQTRVENALDVFMKDKVKGLQFSWDFVEAKEAFLKGYEYRGQWRDKKEEFKAALARFRDSVPVSASRNWTDELDIAIAEIVDNAFDAVLSYYDPLVNPDGPPDNYKGKIEVFFDVNKKDGLLNIRIKDNGMGKDAASTEQKRGSQLYFGREGTATGWTKQFAEDLGGRYGITLGSKNNPVTETVMSIPIERLQVKWGSGLFGTASTAPASPMDAIGKPGSSDIATQPVPARARVELRQLAPGVPVVSLAEERELAELAKVEPEKVDEGLDSVVYKAGTTAFKVYKRLSAEEVEFYRDITWKIKELLEKRPAVDSIIIDGKVYKVKYVVNPIRRVFANRAGKMVTVNDYIESDPIESFKPYLDQIKRLLAERQAEVVNYIGNAGIEFFCPAGTQVRIDRNSGEITLVLTDVSLSLAKLRISTTTSKAAAGVKGLLDKQYPGYVADVNTVKDNPEKLEVIFVHGPAMLNIPASMPAQEAQKRVGEHINRFIEIKSELVAYAMDRNSSLNDINGSGVDSALTRLASLIQEVRPPGKSIQNGDAEKVVAEIMTKVVLPEDLKRLKDAPAELMRLGENGNGTWKQKLLAGNTGRELPPIIPKPVTISTTRAMEPMYMAAREVVADIVSSVNREAYTFITSPARDSDEIGRDVGIDKAFERQLKKQGHFVRVNRYALGPGSAKDLRGKIQGLVGEFNKAVNGNPKTTRWAIRILQEEDRDGLLKLIQEELRKQNTVKDEAGVEVVNEAAVASALSKVRFIGVSVDGDQYLNPIVDLCTDFGMLELDRYRTGDYQGSASYAFKEGVARLLRESTENFDNVNGDNIEDTIKKIFDGNETLKIRAIDWKSVDQWKDSQEAVLSSV